MNTTFLKKLTLRLRQKFGSFRFPFRAYAVKTQAAGRQTLLAQSREEDELQLVHAPAKQENRAFIYSIVLGEILGEVDEKTTKLLCDYFGKGFCLDGEIYKLEKVDKEQRFSFLIYDTSDFLKGEVIPKLTN